MEDEARQVLKELQEALYAIEEHKSSQGYKKSQDDADDDDSDGHELSLLMENLVAELRANLQEENVEDSGTAVPEQEENTGVARPAGKEGEEARRPPPQSDLEHIPLANKQFVVPVSDFTNKATAQLSPAQKSLLERLRCHLSQKPKHCSPEEDRVHQEIPDLETSHNAVQFDNVTRMFADDPDYVPVEDFTPLRMRKMPFKVEDLDVQRNTGINNSQVDKQASQQNARHLNRYISAHHSREEEIIERLAKSQAWRRICTIAFQTDLPDPSAPTHKMRLVE